MSEWKEYKLNDLVTKLGDGLHGTPKYDPEGDYYFINGSNLIDGKISVNDNTKRVSKAEFDKYKKELSDRTIFVSINGTLGNIATYNNEKIILGKSACYFNVKDGVCKEFIKYIATDKSFQHYISEYATGSTIKNVPLKTIRDYTLKLPSLPTQTAIAEILSSLDDKIELNNKINKELEDLAQTLFKRWFIDFEFPNENGEPYKSSGGEMVESELGEIPKGWGVYSMDELLETVSKTYPLKKVSEVVFLNTGDIQDGKFLHKNFSNPQNLPGQAKKSISQNDILYSEIRPANKRFAYVYFDSSQYVVSTKLMVLRSKVEMNSLFQYFYLTQQESIKHLQQLAESRSGTFPQITFSEVSTIKIALPDFDLVNSFVEIALKPYYDNQFHIKEENESLVNLRDTLLPKLISGELEVNNINF